MKKIQSKMNQKEKAPKNNSSLAPSGTAAVSSKSATLQIGTNPLPSFSGDPGDYLKWAKRTRATLGQTSTYKQFLSQNEVDRNEEFFHMIMFAIGDKHALNVFEKSEQDNGESGHLLWKAREK